MLIIILYYFNPELLRDVYEACDVYGGTVVFNFSEVGKTWARTEIRRLSSKYYPVAPPPAGIYIYI